MTARRSPRRLGAALVATAALVSGCGFHGLYSTPLPGGASLGDHPYEVTAYFDDALDLVPQSAVKVDDVPVGKVKSIALAECPDPDSTASKPKHVWCAKVVVQVNGSVKLPANARAEVLQTSLLGEKYVSLEKPTTTASDQRLVDKAQIPLSLTRSAPEAEDVLGALSLVLNEGGLPQIQLIAKELNAAIGSKDRQAAVRDLIAQLNTFTGTLDDQKDTITTALERVDTLSITLRKQEGVIKAALDTFPAALRVLNSERGKLVQLLSSLSNLGAVAQRVVNSTQQTLTAALKSLGPTVRALTAAGSNLVGGLRIAGTFPFPLGNARQFVKGDYANLDADLRIDLGVLVDQITKGLCPTDAPTGLAPLCSLLRNLPLSARETPITVPSGTSAASAIPTFIGAGD